jgi:RNA polymerase sigma factor (sigma-70 family)
VSESEHPVHVLMMDNVTDSVLIARFLDGDRQDAFRELVERHSAMVHGCALRIVGDHQTAQDVTQAVFILLSRKAASLKNYHSIAGWLYRCASFIARDVVKVSKRRALREREAAPVEPDETRWNQLSALLDAGMDGLSETDRHAILLRFFQNRSFRDVGEALGLSEDTAQKRVTRALDRLRTLLLSRGVVLSALTLASLVSANAAPTTSAVTRALLVSSASAVTPTSAPVSTILKFTVKAMILKKLKITAVAVLILLAVVGGAGSYLVHARRSAEPVTGVRSGSPIAVLGALARAADTHDAAAIAAAVHVNDPDRKRRLDSLIRWIDSVGRFDRACRRAFGDGPTDTALWNSQPRLLYRLEFGQENLAMATQEVSGDAARVNIQRAPGFWQYIRFQRVDGVWKIHEEAVDDIAGPEAADRYSKIAPVLDSITQDVDSGLIKSARAAMERFTPAATSAF